MSMNRRMQHEFGFSGSASQLDLLWIMLVAFCMIIFAMMAQRAREAAEAQMVEKVKEIIKRSPEELHAHFTWIPYRLDEASHGIVVGGTVISGAQLDAIFANYHITLYRDGWTSEQDPAWWRRRLEAAGWDSEKSSTHGPTKGFDDEEMYSPLDIRFHGTMPTDRSIIAKIEKIKLFVRYRISGGQVVIGGVTFPQNQFNAMLSQTEGLFIYLNDGNEPDPAWLEALWRKYHFADFDKFEDLWKR